MGDDQTARPSQARGRMLSTAGDFFRAVPPSSRREPVTSIDAVTDVAVNKAAIGPLCQPPQKTRKIMRAQYARRTIV